MAEAAPAPVAPWSGISTMQSTTFVIAAMPVTTQLSRVRLTRPTATPTT